MKIEEVSAEDKIISEWERRRYRPKPGEPELPPQLSGFANKSTDEVLKEINRLPFFMTELDETDGEGGQNESLEALKSLAYDGEPHEIAANFKNQGNECYKVKRYKDAVQFYTQGIEIECKDDQINTALLINRAACNLELKNYRMCIEDCKKALLIDENNVKACYRAGRAFFAVNRYQEAKEILRYGLTKDPENQPMKDTFKNIEEKEQQVKAAIERKEEKAARKKEEERTLDKAIELRRIKILKSPRPPALLEDTKMKLEDPLDMESQLILPAMILYPTTDEFDFVAEVSELSAPIDVLTLLMDRPAEWFDDPKHENFSVKNLECYMETLSGGLIKVGKKTPIANAIMADGAKAPLFDNGLRLYVVPKQESSEWIKTWSKEAALAKRQL
uniref:Cns1/TTC4 wheel domain-containing protein n=1 Tax=Candidozyma auris TaxID=498019 RepID=A0A0L0P4L5_CANAR